MRESIERLNTALAAQLRAESAYRKRTQMEVAVAIGRSQSYVSSRWNGDEPLMVSEFFAWCDLLGVSPVEVLTAAQLAVSPSRDDFDLVAKDPGREPDGDDEHFM